MKLAFSTLGCPAWSLDQVTGAACELGYDGVELRLLDGEVIPPDLAADERQRVRRAFAGAGVEIACLDTSARFTAPEPEARRKQEEDVRRYLALANEWETPRIRVFGGNLAPGQTEAEGVDLLAESLARLAPDAERAGVTVCLETHDAFSAGRLVGEVMGRVPSAGVGALWDTHHPYRMNESESETWGYIGSRLVHTHVKDARRKPDGGWQLCLLGEGEVPVRAALATWVANGYDGYVCVEWEKKWHPEIEEPEVAFPQHIATLRRYLNEV
jgi:sugar phosphate isomerase/epimerase